MASLGMNPLRVIGFRGCGVESEEKTRGDESGTNAKV